MLITISYINLLMLFAVSICHIILFVVYHDQCPTSPFLPTTLGITGIIGSILSLIALIIRRCDVYENSDIRNLLLTCILFIYLFASRIIVSIIAFRLASQTPDHIHCATILYWTSSLLILVSYSILIITSGILIKLILLQRRSNYFRKSVDVRLSMISFS